MIIALHIIGFYLSGVVLAVILAKLYNKKFAFTSNDEIGVGECFLSWFIVVVSLLIIGFKIAISLLETIDKWLKR